MLRFRQVIISVSLCIIGLVATGLQAENAPASAQSASAAKPQDVLNLDKLTSNPNPLNLNSAQQQVLAALRKEQVDSTQKIHALQRQLMELSYSDSYDEDAVEELAGQIAKATETDLAAHSKKVNAFYLSLSPEQRKQYKAFEQRRQKMIEQRMGAGRPAMAQPPKPPAQKTP